jgi:putative transcriptional regulator
VGRNALIMVINVLIFKRVEKILDNSGFNYCLYEGCFDIAASRDFTVFLKILTNVDSFQENQANNLKIISENMDAAIGLVGIHTRREELKDNIVYERFDVPTFTPNTLENILVNDIAPVICRFRGGLFAEINAEKLRKNRQAAGLTQSDLAEHVGVTKKSIYEHEHEDKKADLGVVKKIEKYIGSVVNPQSLMKKYSFQRNEPHERFEAVVSKDLRGIGFGTDIIYQTPFNIVAKERKMLIMSRADDNSRKIKKAAPFISQISDITKVPAVAITKEEINIDIPSISEKELREMKMRDIKKFIK